MSAQPKYWEPVTFQVGDRVRVRLSGECLATAHPRSEAALRGVTDIHFANENGRIGTITDPPTHRRIDPVMEHYVSQGHRYLVTYDVEFRHPAMWGARPDGMFAAAELELIEAAS